MTSPKERTPRYSIEIKDASGQSVWFAANARFQQL
jgi:hypothetical protein